jgi:hypothetical protein
VNGAGAGQFDVLAVNPGPASLKGKLSLKRLATFKPAVGTTVGPLLTASSVSGKFSKAIGGVINSKAGTYFDPQYTSTDVSLIVRQAALTVPASAGRGSSPTISGTGWPEKGKITLTFLDANGANGTTATVSADASGSFSTNALTIPAGAATGNGTITAKSLVTAVKQTQTINIT